MNRKLFPVAILLLGFSGEGFAATTQLVTNGGFESGNFGGWSVVNLGSGGCGTNTWTVNSTGTHGCSSNVGNMPAPSNGTFAAYNTFDGPAGTLQISQQITLPGAISAATLSFFDTVRMNIGTSVLPRTFRIDLYDATNTILLDTLFSQSFQNVNQDWVFNSVDVTNALLNDAGQTVTLRVSNVIPQSFTGPAGFGIDDVSLQVTSVPEPETYAMMLAGLGLVGYAARRRRG